MHTEKSLATILAETKAELTRFVTTRLEILKAEMDEKIRAWKAAIPILLGALALLMAGWMALTFALIALLHGLFLPSPYAWLWASLIVAVVYLALGAALGWFAYGEISAAGLTPNRTLNVLKQDQVWIQNEARTA
ncbi:MAG: phage holin family protein [Candidatus Angelobacter sp.]